MTHWDWHPDHGYQNVPDWIRDHAYSFYSKLDRSADAINWNGSSKEERIISPGDYRWNWDFGHKIDAIEVH